MTDAMKEPQVDIGQLIVASPDIRHNRARIAGTGVTVHRVVGWYRLGLTPEEISDRIGHLNLAQVYAALAYYHANREQVEAALRPRKPKAIRPFEIARLSPGTKGARIPSVEVDGVLKGDGLCLWFLCLRCTMGTVLLCWKRRRVASHIASW